MTTQRKTLLLSVDGGGSKTSVLIADGEGRILGSADAGASNYHTVGLEGTDQAFRRAIGAAREAAHLDSEPFTVACFGLAGVDRPEDRRAIGEIISALPWSMETMIIENDAFIGLAAATLGQAGVIVVCGTGSIALGVSEAGVRARAGGWGYLLGDEGSGYDIGLKALRAIVRADDGRAPVTALTCEVLKHLDLDEPRELITYVYEGRPSRGEIAALAPLVFAAAEGGDAVARELVHTAAGELARCALAVLRAMNMLERPSVVGLSGGAFHCAYLADAFCAHLKREAPLARVVSTRFAPVYGGIILALQRVHGYQGDIPAEYLCNLEGRP